MKISEKEYAELKDAQAKLNALENGGVDNWDNYDDALDDYYRHKEIENEFDEAWSNALSHLSSCVDEPAGSGCGYGFTNNSNEMRLAVEEVKTFISNFYEAKK